MTSENPDKTQKINELLRTIAAVLVPIVVAILGLNYNSEISNRETAVRFVELAISILNESPIEGENDPLREWAIKIVNQNSTVKLSEEAQTILKERAIVNVVDGSRVYPMKESDELWIPDAVIWITLVDKTMPVTIEIRSINGEFPTQAQLPYQFAIGNRGSRQNNFCVRIDSRGQSIRPGFEDYVDIEILFLQRCE